MSAPPFHWVFKIQSQNEVPTPNTFGLKSETVKLSIQGGIV